MPERTILDEIIEYKREEIEARKSIRPYSELKARSEFCPATRGFCDAITATSVQGKPALIAEVKKASPSAGIIREDFDPVNIARIYSSNGATCLSVLTDEHFFQGHDKFLVDIRQAVAIPILRKDFTVDPYQIYEARVIGADAILLIAAVLSQEQLVEYQAIAKSIDLAALVEVHTEAEMEMAISAGATLIGINSRNLATFVTDLAVVDRLAAMAPKEAQLVAESGIKTSADVQRVAKAGAKAILVGESLMRKQDIGAAVKELMSI